MNEWNTYDSIESHIQNLMDVFGIVKR
ncbi:unnamed protein product [Debaryomyces tyrocola]|nr:unnamed protein product [Debaryomyces tyrocola]